MKIYLILLLVFIYARGYCQSDTIFIHGKLRWDRANISGFPENIKIINDKSAIFKLAKVDSLGMFQASLSEGSYSLKPSSYHWQGNDIIRINVEKSTKGIKLQEHDSYADTITLNLQLIDRPDLIPIKGILHDFQKSSKPRIDNFIKEYMTYYEVPGISLAVIKDGVMVHHNTYGVLNAETNENVNSATLFEAGSITKISLAFIAMRLWESGIIDLDKPLYNYLDFEDISHDDNFQLITARMILSHQTGFPNWANGKFDFKFKPGTMFGYSGEAFEYLKRVLEKVSKRTITELIQDEFINPLQLDNIFFSEKQVPIEHLSNGHKNGKVSKKRSVKSPMMAYSMVTNADALAKFAIALRNRKGLKEATYNEMFKIHSIREDGTHWGLGFRIEETDFGRTYGHSGSTKPGFIGNYVYYDKMDMGYVVLTNSQMGGWLSLPLLTRFLITGKEE